MKFDEVNKEQFDEWRCNPVTMAILDGLETVKALLLNDLGEASTISNKSAEETAILTARVVGQIQGLNQILGLKYEDVENVEYE